MIALSLGVTAAISQPLSNHHNRSCIIAVGGCIGDIHVYTIMYMYIKSLLLIDGDGDGDGDGAGAGDADADDDDGDGDGDDDYDLKPLLVGKVTSMLE